MAIMGLKVHLKNPGLPPILLSSAVPTAIVSTTMTSSENSRSRPSKPILLLQELRAPFFTASVVPILVGTSLAFYHTHSWNWPLFLLALAAIVLIHAGANVANDYFDHLSGNDAANVDYVRPFTGGSRMIQNKLLSPREVLTLSLACFAAGGAIGVYLAAKLGFLLLAFGIVGMLGGFFYTAPPLSLVSRGIGELVIGINFGVLPVVGAYFVQTGAVRWEAALFSLPVAVLISAILFINQFQDYEADKVVGKRNWVVRLGRRKSVWVFAAMMSICWVLPIVAAVVLKAGPVLCLIALIPGLAAFKAIRTAFAHYDHPRQLTPANAMTVISHLAIGLLLSISLVAAGCRRAEKPAATVAETGPVQFQNVAEIRLPAPGTPQEAAYLGIPDGNAEFQLVDIESSLLVIQLFDMYCMNCQKDAPEVNRFYGLLQASDLRDRVKMLGIGKGNTETEASIYLDRYDVKFPLFPDQAKINTKRLGTEVTPTFVIVDMERKAVTHQQWRMPSAEEFLDKLRTPAEKK